MRKNISGLSVAPETRALALEQVAQGKARAAIKLVRAATRSTAAEAREYVDELKAEVLVQKVPAEIKSRAQQLVVKGDWVQAAKIVRQETELGLREAKEYVDVLRAGRLEPRAASGGLSDRVRAFKAAGDRESAIALVRAETGMSRDEAERFVEALEQGLRLWASAAPIGRSGGPTRSGRFLAVYWLPAA